MVKTCFVKKSSGRGQHRWITPVILAIQEAEIRVEEFRERGKEGIHHIIP
jgi:hypothetical protein